MRIVNGLCISKEKGGVCLDKNWMLMDRSEDKGGGGVQNLVFFADVINDSFFFLCYFTLRSFKVSFVALYVNQKK